MSRVCKHFNFKCFRQLCLRGPRVQIILGKTPQHQYACTEWATPDTLTSIYSQLHLGKTKVLKASKAVGLKLFHPLPQIITHIDSAIHVTPKRNQNSVLSPQARLILTVHASSKQSRDPGFEDPRPAPGPFNPQMLPATLCYVPRGGIWNAHILILSMAQPTEIAEAILETWADYL